MEEMMRRDDSYDHNAWLRSKRIFHRDDAWYVATREGELGPFPLLEMAVIEWKRYLKELSPAREGG